jgi:hypothetical protein
MQEAHMTEMTKWSLTSHWSTTARLMVIAAPLQIAIALAAMMMFRHRKVIMCLVIYFGLIIEVIKAQ